MDILLTLTLCFVFPCACLNANVQYCAKVMQANFAEFPGFSWLFEEISLRAKLPRHFHEISKNLLFQSGRTFEG